MESDTLGKNENKRESINQSKTEEESDFYNDEFLKKNTIQYRQYQDNIIKKCRKKNSLIVLPTGLGKTIIGILLIAKRLKKYKSHGKILILAPTRPLVAQHLSSCQKFLNLQDDNIQMLTGRVPPEKRMTHFKKARIIISTPQVIKNDVMRGRYYLNDVVLTIFDEAHRTRGNYAYTFLSKEYMGKCQDPLLLGLTASPGKDYETIQELCNNLFIENIIFKTYEDKDVKGYIHEIDIFLEKVDLPIKILEISQIMEDLFQTYLRFFIERKLINPYKKYYSKMDFLRIAQDLTFSLKYRDLFNNNEFKEEFFEELHFNDPPIINIVRENELDIHSIFSYCSSCISLLHAKELLETQEMTLFQTFLKKLTYKAEQDNLSAKRIINSDHFKLIVSLIEKKSMIHIHHPKIDKLLDIIREEIKEFQNDKILIFTQYREMADILITIINNEFKKDLIAKKFIGQSTTINEQGFSQNKQMQILKDFRSGEINVLTATSVAEEGLDIPNVDAIIFYEPVASEIRHIQRRGRTGRHSPGRCYILIAKDSVDVPFFKVAKKKENAMNTTLIDSSQLDLVNNIKRKDIHFPLNKEAKSELEIIKNYRKRKKKEKELLANRSIEEIIDNIDKFSESKKFNDYKNHGITFFSDLVQLNKNKLKKKLMKMKNNNSQEKKPKKQYLNHNVKTIIRLVKTYSKNGKISFKKLKQLAEFEDIIDRKFYIHFNRACYLHYIKKKGEFVYFLKYYE
jgi:Fanconi anemia group M protein